MPRRPKTICRAAGCNVLIDAPGHCEKHRKAKDQGDRDRRGTSAERGYGGKWRAARDAYLQANPLCVYCQRIGRVEAATVVDHVTPHHLKEAKDSGDQDRIARAEKLFWSRSNWQSLCGPCHNSVKQREERY